ncbi:hypothetical protein EO219_07280 [Fusobacterium necrophorum subsp. necrophorum]|nr:hypothetical protein [Fusobacterium necrophorum]AZW09388.1 hypothetical protein EO219_07280 [Fusobacterium necrophorum subsp. necrophorum]
MKEIHAKGRIYRSPVFVSNKIYIGDEEGNMTCYLIEKGMEKKKAYIPKFFQKQGILLLSDKGQLEYYSS